MWEVFEFKYSNYLMYTIISKLTFPRSKNRDIWKSTIAVSNSNVSFSSNLQIGFF